jgi:hypothetical protein
MTIGLKGDPQTRYFHFHFRNHEQFGRKALFLISLNFSIPFDLPFWIHVAVEMGCVGWHLEGSLDFCQHLFRSPIMQSTFWLAVFGPSFCPSFCPTVIRRSTRRSIHCPPWARHFLIVPLNPIKFGIRYLKPDRCVPKWRIDQQKDWIGVRHCLTWSKAGWLGNYLF